MWLNTTSFHHHHQRRHRRHHYHLFAKNTNTWTTIKAGVTRLKYSRPWGKRKNTNKSKRNTHSTSTQNSYVKERKALKLTNLTVCLNAVSEKNAEELQNSFSCFSSGSIHSSTQVQNIHISSHIYKNVQNTYKNFVRTCTTHNSVVSSQWAAVSVLWSFIASSTLALSFAAYCSFRNHWIQLTFLLIVLLCAPCIKQIITEMNK